MNENGKNYSIAAMICGILGLVTSCFIIGVVPAAAGLVLSTMCLAKGYGSKGFNIIGLLSSMLAILLFIIIVFFGILGSTVGL